MTSAMDTTTETSSILSSPPTKKSVSFHDSCHVSLIPMPTLNDCFNAWYQQADYEFFKTNTMRLIKQTSNRDQSKKSTTGTISQEELSCLMGLEVMQGERSKVRRSRRDRIRTIVLMSYFQSSEAVAQDCWTVSEESTEDAKYAADMVAHQVFQDTVKWLASTKKTVSSTSSKPTRGSSPCRRTTFFSSKSFSSLMKESSYQRRQRWMLSTTVA